MATQKAGVDKAIIDVRAINEIFNPYLKESYCAGGKVTKTAWNAVLNASPVLEKVAVLPNMMISSGLFSNQYEGEQVSGAIFVYKVKGSIAALSVSEYYKPKTGGKNSVVFGYYDKGLEEYLAVAGNKTTSEEEIYKTQYLAWHFGMIRKSDIDLQKDWINVPRELFSNICDYVYLCVCTLGREYEPKIRYFTFPRDRLFFYDIPTVSSVYSGQTYADSRFVGGMVMRYEIPRIADKSSDMGYVPCDGEYQWQKPLTRISLSKDQNFKILKTANYYYSYRSVKYLCSPVEIYVYKKEEAIRAFVWASGNEDDRIKKSYVNGPKPTLKGEQIDKAISVDDLSREYPYNAYTYLDDSLSSDTLYFSYPALTRLTAANSALYVAKTLAKQPSGRRSFSIDGNNLVFLMGGAVYFAERLVVTAIGEDRATNEDEKTQIDSLFKANNSYLFWDSPITYYSNTDSRVVYYLKNVLGIESGSNGCERIRKMLSLLFKGIARIGINIDYICCDIEGPWNDAASLRTRRFNVRWLNGKNGTSSLKTFYNSTISSELKKREDIYEKMLHRGLDLSQINIYDEIHNYGDNYNSYLAPYGISAGRSLEKRRNINIWNAVMKSYENELLSKYVIDPALESFKNAKCTICARGSQKGYINHSALFESYLGGSISQGSDIYSCGGSYGGVGTLNYKKLCMDNRKVFPNDYSLYSQFMDAVNSTRSMLLSSRDDHNPNGKYTAFVSSFNIWVSRYLVKDDNLTATNTLLRDSQRYYKEFLYHLVLSCPDKIYAYFSAERNYQRKQDNYYFPYGNPDVSDVVAKYYQSSYAELQEVLSEINSRLSNTNLETVVSELADEDLPFVISGVRNQGTILWRITFDEEINDSLVSKNTREVRISVGRFGSIRFSKGKVLAENNQGFGIWIETPDSTSPLLEAKDDDSQMHPVFCTETRSGNLLAGCQMNEYGIRYPYLYTHTLFGQTPGLQTYSLRFKLVNPVESSAKLLWSDRFSTNITAKNEKHIALTIGNLLGNGDGLTISTFKGSQKLKVGKEKLVVGSTYELICYVNLTSMPTSNPVLAKVRYELWLLNKNAVHEKLIYEDNRDIKFSNPNGTENFIDSMYLISPADATWKYEAIQLQSFKVYFSQSQEKLELFRESDGVDISIVNRATNAYRDIPVDTFRENEKLTGKITWLNATNQTVEYQISFTQYDEIGKVLGTDNQTVQVEKQSSGYRLIDLPELNPLVSRVVFSYEKSVGETPNENAFINDFYNAHRLKQINVSII